MTAAALETTIINAIEFGGDGSAIKGRATASYRNNISITACQFDAGIKLGLDFENYTHIHIAGNLWGGACTNRLVNCGFLSGGLSETQSSINYGRIQEHVRIGQTLNIFNLELPTDYSSVYVEITTEGLVHGIGAAITTSQYQLTRNTTGQIAVKRIESAGNGHANAAIAHMTSVSGNTVTFQAKVNSTNDNGTLRTSARIVGAYGNITQ